MSKEPESLEETQRRLAGYGPSPYGPSVDQEVPAVDIPAADAPAATRSARRPLLVLALAGVLAAGGVGVGVALLGGGVAGPDWTAYPGSAYRSVPEVLASDSLEVVVANGDAFVADYKRALTDEFGFTWIEIAPAQIRDDINGYGGDSLLQSYDSALWQGALTLDDPAARQKVSDVFEEIALAHDAEEVSFQNESSIDDSLAREMFGAAEKPDQPLWSQLGVRYQPHNLWFETAVYDRTLPRDESFRGDYRFSIAEDDPNTLFVLFSADAFALLAEADREAFVDALKPYEGLTPPDR